MPENDEKVKEEVTVNEEENVNIIESSVSNEENTDISVSETTSSHVVDKKSSNKKKIDKKSILLILLFIFLFVFIFEIPRISEWLDKARHSGMNEFQQQARELEKRKEKALEEQQQMKEESKKNEVEILNTVKCTMTNDSDEYLTTVTNELLVNTDGEVIDNNLIYQYDYHDTSKTYITNKNECNNSELKNKTIEGFSYECASTDIQLKFVYKFELSKVTEVKYTKVDGTNTSVVPSVKLKDSITETKNELMAKGFVCE